MTRCRIAGVALLAALVFAGCEDRSQPLASSVDEAGAQLSRSPKAEEHASNPVFRSNLVGNSLTGAAAQIRGRNAGGLPWVIDPRSEARVDADEEGRVTVRGLVIDPNASSPNAGINPVASFRAVVSCLTPSGGTLIQVDRQTEPFPASREGNARIRQQLDLPDPCLAPVIFVTSPAGAWFAVTGF